MATTHNDDDDDDDDLFGLWGAWVSVWFCVCN